MSRVVSSEQCKKGEGNEKSSDVRDERHCEDDDFDDNNSEKVRSKDVKS